jgi:hypothetical protein
LPAPHRCQALAQEAAPKPIQRVEITGSNIRRSEAETASSVITVNRADIEKSGKSTVAELLQTLAVDNQGSVPTTFGNGFAAGASGISLRGLGAASTLVLLNGRRMAPYGLADDGQKQFSDLNVIPTDAVDRIEVLKDGASAIYGSDAIAGVVNIILRRDYVGNTLRFSRGGTEEWDGKRTTIAFTKGVGNLDTDRYNILFSIEYKKFDEIWYRDRSDRDYIGRIDLRPWGYSANEALGGTGAIVPGSGTGRQRHQRQRAQPPGHVQLLQPRRPGWRGLHPHLPGRGLLELHQPPAGRSGRRLPDRRHPGLQPDRAEAGKPEHLPARHLAVTPDIQVYSELNYYVSQTDSSTTPSSVSASVGYPGGPVNNGIVQLGAAIRTTPTSAPRRAALPGGRRRPARLQHRLQLHPLDRRRQGQQFRLGLGHRPAVLAQPREQHPDRLPAARRHLRPARPERGQRRRRNGQQSGLCGPAARHGVAHRRERRPELAGHVCGPVADHPQHGQQQDRPVGLQGLARVRQHSLSDRSPRPGAWAARRATNSPSCSQPPAPSAATSSAWATRPTPASATCSPCTPKRWRRCPTTSSSRRRCAGTTLPTSATPGRRSRPEVDAGALLRPARHLRAGFRAPSPAENGVGGLAAFSTASDPVRCAWACRAPAIPPPSP